MDAQPTKKGPPIASGGISPGVKLAIEAGPLVVFFVCNAKFGIFVATGAFMAAITASLATSWRLEKRLPPMALFTGFFVLVFGGLTLILADELFIKLKPTIVNSLVAVILTGGLLAKKLLLKVALGSSFHLKDEGWRKLTVRWIFFFLLLAAVNEYVWRNYSTDTWVSFKVFGIMPLTIVFSATLLPLIQRYQIEDPAGEPQNG